MNYFSAALRDLRTWRRAGVQSGTVDARGLTEILRAYVLPGNGQPLQLDITGPISRSPWSLVFRGDDRSSARSVVVKICLDASTGRPAPADAQDYFDALGRVMDVFRRAGHSGYSEPLLLLDTQGIVVATWVDGPTVARLIGGGSMPGRCEAARRSGEWLARFQRGFGLSYLPMDVDAMLAQTEQALRAGAQHGQARVLGDALAALRQTAGLIGGAPIPWSRLHGDFKPGNLIVGKDGVTAIDIALRQPGPCVLDASHFLNHVALQRPVRFLLRGQLGMVEAAFRQGSREGGVVLPTAHLAWARVHHAIRLLLRYGAWSRPPRSWFTGWVIRRLLRRLSDELLRMPAVADGVHGRLPD